MLSKLSKCFYKITRGWLILLILVIFAAFLTVTLPALQAASGDVEGLDTSFFYTPDEAFRTVASYTEVGRTALRTLYLTVDVAYPILYTFLLTLLISWIFKHGFPQESAWRKLNILPVGMAAFDLVENISIVTMLANFPKHPQVAAWSATIGTLGKYLFLIGSIGLIITGLVRVLLHRTTQLSQKSAVGVVGK